MKTGGVNGLRRKQLLLASIVFCTTLLIWGWERAPNQATFLPSHEDLYPQVAHLKYEQKADEAQENQAQLSGDEQKVEEAQENQVQLSSDEPKADEAQENQAQLSSDEPRADEAQENQADLSRDSGCNYGKGRWVEDETRALYSGFECKQWLSESWSCRLTQRPDFSYEKYRWQPEDCNLPVFNSDEFLSRMQDKTLALVGDSLGRQQFQSLMCMVTGGKERADVEDVGQKYGFITGDERPSGWAYRFPETNTTILYYWSATLCELEPLNVSDPSTMFAMHLDRPAGFLAQNLHRLDVVVLNTGHHWNRPKFTSNRWIMYANGLPVTDMKLARMDRAKNFTIYSVVRWLDSQLPLYPQLKVFFRSISPRHFFNGEWNTGGTCDNTRPLAGGNAVPLVAVGDPLVMGAVSGTQVKILDITDLSQLRDEGHISRFGLRGAKGVQDCLHWCLPGIPDTWNEILAAQI